MLEARSVALVGASGRAGSLGARMTEEVAKSPSRPRTYLVNPRYAEIGGVRFVNDSKATNVESALRSIESFDRDLVVILGGRFKGGDLRLLREPLHARAKAVVVIGESRPLFRDALRDAIPVHEDETFAAAIRRAYALAQPSGVVLLAPACASFDMFRDYAERGRKFKEEVAKL